MLVLEVFRYLHRRVNIEPVRLANFVSMSGHHGSRRSEPKVSIVIPTRDKHELLRICIESIRLRTKYKNYEILVIDNSSKEESTKKYLKNLEKQGVSVLDYPHAFNYSAISNFAAANTKSEFLCFLNNDTEVTDPHWLGNLMDHAVQVDVGVVGSLLLYPDGRVQHLGIALGYKGVAGHVFAGEFLTSPSVQSLKDSCFEISAVTFACALVSRENFTLVSGLDPMYGIGLNDVDFCIRAAKLGLRNVVCTCSSLIHLSFASRRSMKSIVGASVAVKETLRFIRTHGLAKKDDYFLVNLYEKS